MIGSAYVLATAPKEPIPRGTRNNFCVLFVSCLFLLIYFPLNAHPAALSFFAIDLKYNESQGVKICEIQPGINSKFLGFDYSYGGEGLIGGFLCDYLSLYQEAFWYQFSDICDKKMLPKFHERGWHAVKNLSKLESDQEFQKRMSGLVFDPSDISQYRGVLCMKIRNDGVAAKFRRKYPALLLLDEGTYPFGADKYQTNKLLTDIEKLSHLKSRWNLYPKKFTPSLPEQIKSDLDCDRYVIKPRKGTLGRGVIIVDRKDLAPVLKKILKNSKNLTAKKNGDYEHWDGDKNEGFLVEEFIASDPIIVPHLGSYPFDPTMRVVVLLAHSQGKYDVHFLASYWKLPEKPLTKKGSLNELHKSYGQPPYYAQVSPEIEAKVFGELKTALPLLFEKILK